MTNKERQKQRMVGATILCVMALLVLFLLLQTPEPEQLDVDFSFPAEPELASLPAEPVISQQEREQLIEQVAADWREHAPTPEEAEQAAKEQEKDEDTAPYLSGWAVQLWSLANEQSAQKMVSELNKAGFSAFIREAKIKDKALYRVYAGPELSKSKAQTLLNQLKEHEVLQISQGLIVLLPE